MTSKRVFLGKPYNEMGPPPTHDHRQHDDIVKLRVSGYDKKRLEAYAAEHGCTVSSVVRDCILYVLETREKAKGGPPWQT